MLHRTVMRNREKEAYPNIIDAAGDLVRLKDYVCSRLREQICTPTVTGGTPIPVFGHSGSGGSCDKCAGR